MQFKTLILCDVGHHFVAVDGTAVRAALAVVEHFVSEFENGFPIQAAHEIGVKVVASLRSWPGASP